MNRLTTADADLIRTLEATFGHQFADLRATLTQHATNRYAMRDVRMISKIVVHHSDTPTTTTWTAIASYHVNDKDHEWPGIGYHFGVETSGRVVYLGDVETIRYHARQANTTSIGVCCIGDYQKTAPPVAMLDSLSRLIGVLDRWHMHWTGKSIASVTGHRDEADTTCPGDRLYAALGKLSKQSPQQGNRTMRIGRGAGPSGLNLQVIPFRARLDWKESDMLPDSLVWQIVDLFTTKNGNWDVETQAAIIAAQTALRRRQMTESDEVSLGGALFGIDQWARDAYLFPPDDPRYCSEGGADHDILVCVQGPDGARIEGAGVAFSSDGPAWLQPPTDLNHVAVILTKSHGWCDLTMFGGSTSYPPALGPWTAGKLSEVNASDLVTGMGMPWNWHVSTFIVYQAIRWADLQPFSQTLAEKLLAEGERRQVIQFNPNAALQRRIFAAGFVPNSPEFEVDDAGNVYAGQRAEDLETGEVRIYYARQDDWSNVQFVTRPAA